MTFKKQRKKLSKIEQNKIELVIDGHHAGFYTNIDEISRNYNNYKIESIDFKGDICMIHLNKWG